MWCEAHLPDSYICGLSVIFAYEAEQGRSGGACSDKEASLMVRKRVPRIRGYLLLPSEDGLIRFGVLIGAWLAHHR